MATDSDLTFMAEISLPAHIPAACVAQSAADYKIPEMLLLSIMKVESDGKTQAVNANSNGTLDIGITQLNTASWVPYMNQKYGIRPHTILNDPCQAIRAAAYVVKKESFSRQCSGDWWCAAGRYHSPNNPQLQYIYKTKLHNAWNSILKRGSF